MGTRAAPQDVRRVPRPATSRHRWPHRGRTRFRQPARWHRRPGDYRSDRARRSRVCLVRHRVVDAADGSRPGEDDRASGRTLIQRDVSNLEPVDRGQGQIRRRGSAGGVEAMAARPCVSAPHITATTQTETRMAARDVIRDQKVDRRALLISWAVTNYSSTCGLSPDNRDLRRRADRAGRVGGAARSWIERLLRRRPTSRTWSAVRDLSCRKYRRRIDDRRRGPGLSRRAGGMVVGRGPRPSGRPFWPSRSDRASAASPPRTICGPSAIFSSGATTHASARTIAALLWVGTLAILAGQFIGSHACSTRSSGFRSRSDA